MSVISEVKCARCDRMYSGVRSRCPYCGARRIGSGKYSEENDNSKGKMIIGVLIMAVLVVAAGVLLFTAPKPVDPDPGPSMSSSPDPSPSNIDEDIEVIEGSNTTSPSPSPTEPESPSPTPPPRVESVVITYSNFPKDDFTATIGETVPLRVKIEPVGIELKEKIIWESSDTSVFDVVADNVAGTAATVKGLGKGTAVLTVYVDSEKAECIVRVIN